MTLRGFTVLRRTGRQVGGNLAGSLAGLQFPGKELLRGPEGISVFSLLLVGHEIEIGITLLLDGETVEHTADLADEQISGSPVEHQVMDIHQQAYTAFSSDHLKMIERCPLNIEWTHKLPLMGCESLFAHTSDRNLNRHAACQGLHDGVPLCGEVYAHSGMRLYDQFNSTGQFVSRHALGIVEHTCGIIDRGQGILQTLEINAGLGIGQGYARRLFSTLRGSSLVASLFCLLTEYFALHTLNGSLLDQCFRIERDTISLIHLYGEFYGRHRSEAGQQQRRVNTKVRGAYFLGNHPVQFTLHVGLWLPQFFLRLARSTT